MAVTPPEYSSETRAALRTIVAEYGPEALSRPTTMSNLLKDLLPDAPRVARMLVAAAEDHIADALRDYVSQGMDAATAARLTASLFAGATMFSPQACAWVVGEMAIAIGLLPTAAGTPTVTNPPESGSAVPTGRPAARSTFRPAAGPARAANVGAIAYIACENDNSVTPVDLLTGVAGAPIRTGNWSRAIAVTPDHAKAYVTNYGDGTLTPIAISSGTPGLPIKAGNGPIAIAITPDGMTAYVANEGDGTVTPVSLASGVPGAPISTGKRPYAIAITPDGATAYVANEGDGTVTPISPASGRLGVADAAGAPVAVGNGPVAIAITPDGTTAYVANHGDGTVTPIRLAPPARAAAPRLVPDSPITVGKRPWAIAITGDGKVAYVANHGDGTITPVNLASGVPGAPIAVRKRPWAIAFIG